MNHLDRRNLLEMLGPQKEIDVVKRLRAEQRQRRRIDAEHLSAIKRLRVDVLGRQQSVVGVIGAKLEEFLKVKWCGGHGGSS